MKLSEGLKTVFLAGVGAVAITAEKSKQLVDDLVKKGELTVEEGKVINEDLAKKFNEKAEKFDEKAQEYTPDKVAKKVRDALLNLENMSKEARDEIRSKLDALDKAEEEAAAKAAEEEAAAEAADEADVEDAIIEETAAEAEEAAEAVEEAAEEVKEACEECCEKTEE